MEDGKSVHVHIFKTEFKDGRFLRKPTYELIFKVWGYYCMRNDYLDRIPEQYLVSWKRYQYGICTERECCGSLQSVEANVDGIGMTESVHLHSCSKSFSMLGVLKNIITNACS